MAYVSVPKDLTQIKTKFLFNLTKRQVVCFGIGILIRAGGYILNSAEHIHPIVAATVMR